MIEAFEFIQLFNKDNSEKIVFKIGTIDPAYSTGWPKVTFDGESTLAGKAYPCLTSYTPAPNDRVLLASVGHSWVILGRLGVGNNAPGTIPAADVIQDATHRFVADTQITNWNNEVNFFARHNNSSATVGKVIFPTVEYNAGSGYDPVTGLFTAPVAGVYYFRAFTLTSNAEGGEIRFALYKNGGTSTIRTITIKPASSWWTTSAEGIFSLSVGDTVQAYVEQIAGTLYGDPGYNGFMGSLIR